MIVLKEKLFFTQQNVYTSINDTPTTKMHKHEYIEIFYVLEELNYGYPLESCWL